MEQSGFVVVIDLGTSKIVGLMGRKNEQGVISILASESIPSDNCVKYGVVYNIDEAVGKIKKLINLLENKSGRKIGKTYVSIAGKSLRAIEHSVSRDFIDRTEVTFSVIDQMEQQARAVKTEFMTNYSLVSPEIFLDGVLEEDYLGHMATIIEGRYRLIVGRPNIKTNLSKCIVERNQLEIAGYIVGPVAAGAVVLDETDKQAGCALVDFGGGTTTLSIYKDGHLRYMVVIPFGGRTITKDVKELGFVDEAAEQYKIKYGKVGKEKNKQITSTTEVDVKELNKVIQLRVEEIILNVIHQINESGYAGKLDAGIIMIGGASQLSGLSQYLEDKAQMPVKQGAAKRLFINNVTDLLQNPAYAQCLGLLLFANENCEKREQISTANYTDYMNQNRSTASSESAISYSREQASDISTDSRIEELDRTLAITPTNEELEQEPIEEPVINRRIEPIKDIRERSSKTEKSRKSNGIIDLFGKIQNLGGTMFKDED